MGWLIAVLLGLALFGGLAVLGRGRVRGREPTDDTLITELLGPPDVPVPPAPQQPGQANSAPGPCGPPVAEGDWLEDQLAWIAAWSQRMREQIASASQPEPGRKE